MTGCQDLQALAHVPPSVQTVYCAMYGNQPMTGRQLRDATHLPRRTIYAALHRLRELGVIQERASLRDTRQTYYWVGEAAKAEAAHAANWTATPAAPVPALSRTRHA
jgi:DNA-binding MarR family transcriptional regulator